MYTEVQSLVFLATKLCIVVIFFFKMNIISCCLTKTFIRNEIFWATFTRCLFLAVVDKQIIYLFLKGSNNKSPFIVIFSLGCSQAGTNTPVKT